MNHYSKFAALAVAALMGTASALAIPAKPGLMQMPQPDGSTVTVRLVGDEHFHYYLSEAGDVLAPDADGVMRYAALDAQGRVVPGDLSASRAATAQIQAQQPRLKEALRAAQAQAPMRVASLRPMPTLKGGVMRAPTAVPGVGLFDHQFPAMGSPKALVILVEYTDVKFHEGYDAKDYFTRMINEPGFSDMGGTGSALDYFTQNSNGQFTPQFDVLGPVTLPRSMAYYGSNGYGSSDLRPHEMVVDAMDILDPDVDFSQYDTDGNGTIDNVFVFYAGRGEATGGPASSVWPHSYNVTYANIYKYYDGVLVDRYACSNEWERDNKPDGVGTFVHEFSHVMGLPDLYSTDYNTGSFTPGAWSALDYGPYNNNGRTPPNYGAFERFALGWATPEEISGPMNGRLESVMSNEYYLIPTPKDTEFFLLENRQQVDNDKYVPGHGMLVWHVDFNQNVWNQNAVNNTPSHQYVDIEEADGTASQYSQDGDAFPGTAGVTSFTDDTKPSMKTWAKKPLNLPITDIAEEDGVVTFKVCGGYDGVAAPAPAVAHVGPFGFTAAWEPVEGAEGYSISVFTRHDATGARVYVDGYKSLRLGDVAQYTVTGLEPETQYYFSMTAYDAVGEGRACDDVAVATTPESFEFQTPIATEATDVATDGFTANWKAMDGATSYSVQLYTKAAGEPIEVSNGFDNGVDDLKEGWTSSSNATYSMASYAGASIPSLKLSAEGDYLETPAYADGLKTLKFWHRGSNTGASATISVSAFNSQEWATVKTMSVSNDKGGTTIEVEMPAGAVQARITFSRGTDDKGALAVDDVVLGHGAVMTPIPVKGYEDVDAAASLSHVFTGLQPETDYYYTVTAHNGALSSLVSNEIHVLTSAASGVASVEAEGVAVYYDLQGRRVASPAHGVYVKVANGKAVKVVL